MAYFATNDGNLTDVFLNEQDLIDNSLSGSILSWGSNNPYGQLGIDSSSSNFSVPVLTIGGNQWISIGAGAQTSAGIKSDGSLWLWGRGQNGQLGQNNTINRSSPIQTVTAGKDWKSVSVGGGSVTTFTAAIKTDGSLWLWGSNANGRLGDNTIANKSSPVQTVTAGNNWKQISLCDNSSLAIKTDGTLWTWGSNSFGTIGNNTTTHISSPVQTIAGGSNWSKLGTFHGVATNTVAAIKTDGTLWLWGDNTYGGLGDGVGNVFSRSSPVQTIAGGNNWKAVAASSTVAAIKTDGTLWVWGFNGYGTIGNNTNGGSISSPVQTVAGGNNWKSVGVSEFATAIKTDGSLWVWGSNNSGTLGNNTILTHKSSPIQTVAGGNYWIKAYPTLTHVVAITSI